MNESAYYAKKYLVINDPYEGKQKFLLEIGDDLTEEDLEQIAAVMEEDRRLTQNLERKERYHMGCSLDGLEYEGLLFGTGRSAENEYFANEEIRHVDELKSLLSETQLRRFEAYEQGVSLHRIAEAEGVSVMSVKESIDSACKKLKKLL